MVIRLFNDAGSNLILKIFSYHSTGIKLKDMKKFYNKLTDDEAKSIFREFDVLLQSGMLRNKAVAEMIKNHPEINDFTLRYRLADN